MGGDPRLLSLLMRLLAVVMHDTEPSGVHTELRKKLNMKLCNDKKRVVGNLLSLLMRLLTVVMYSDA